MWVSYHKWVHLWAVLQEGTTPTKWKGIGRDPLATLHRHPPPPLYKLRQCTQLLRSLRLLYKGVACAQYMQLPTHACAGHMC